MKNNIKYLSVDYDNESYFSDKSVLLFINKKSLKLGYLTKSYNDNLLYVKLTKFLTIDIQFDSKFYGPYVSVKNKKFLDIKLHLIENWQIAQMLEIIE